MSVVSHQCTSSATGSGIASTTSGSTAGSGVLGFVLFVTERFSYWFNFDFGHFLGIRFIDLRYSLSNVLLMRLDATPPKNLGPFFGGLASSLSILCLS